MPQSGWALPSELLVYFANLLLPSEPYQDCADSFYSPELAQNTRTVKQLTYMCRATRTLLEPLAFRFVLLEDAADVAHYFILMAQNPRLRPFVRHVVCLSSMDWARIGSVSMPRSHALEIWSSRCPSMSVDQVMQQAGFVLDYYYITEGDTRILYSNLIWPDVVKFLFGSFLLMVPGVDTLHFHHSVTDLDAHATNIVERIMKDATKKGYPVMNQLRVMKLTTREDEILSEAAEVFFFTSRQWTSLRTMVLDDIDFDDQFAQLLLEKCFSAELPLEELYVRGNKLGGLVGDPDFADDPNLGTTLDAIFQLVGYDVIKEPTHKVFKNLRLLDIVFPPSPKRSQQGSTLLPLFLQSINGAPETLRLTRHPFPRAALCWAVQERLTNLVLNECTDMPENPRADQLQIQVASLHHGDEPCLPNLKSMLVNGVEYRY